MANRVRVFMTKQFAKFARMERITQGYLVASVLRAESGAIDADLGGGVIKQRIARPGQGRSAGYRTLVAYKSEIRAVFLYGFRKGDRGNISNRELVALKLLAGALLAADDETVSEALGDGSLIEIELERDENGKG